MAKRASKTDKRTSVAKACREIRIPAAQMAKFEKNPRFILLEDVGIYPLPIDLLKVEARRAFGKDFEIVAIPKEMLR